MKLLNKTIRTYAIYSIVTIVLAIPAFYVVINALVVGERDEKLTEQKMIILKNPEKLISAISYDPSYDILRKIAPDLEITLLPLAAPSAGPPAIPAKDSLYNITSYDSLYKEMIPYRVLAFTLISGGKNYEVKIRRPLLEAEDLIQSIVLILSALLVIFVAGLLLLNRQLSGKIWKPFYATLGKLHRYQIEQSEPIRPLASGIEEFDDLSQAISVLTKRNSQVYRSYKEFTENASHEMQTPLAIFRSKLELLIQTQPFTEEQASLVNALSDVNSRLIRLNRSLLLLTKIENNYYNETGPVDLGELVKTITGQMKYLADGREITITERYASREGGVLTANRALLEILVSNLLSNAIRYNTRDGQVEVELEEGILIIRNTGLAEALDAVRIFDRFYKQNAGSQSTGLGLAISKQIADLYGLKLDYTFEGGWHVFTLIPGS